MPSRRDVLAAAATAGVAAIAGCGGDAAADPGERWPQFGYDAANTAHNPDARGPGEEPRATWVRAGGGGYYRNSAQPLVDGAVYANAGFAGSYALDPASGDVRWHDPESYKSLTPALVDGGEGLVLPDSYGLQRVAADGGLPVLDRRVGYRDWETDLDYPESPATVADGALVVGIGEGATGGRAVAVEVADGSVRWEFPVEMPVWATPAVRDGVAYVAQRDDQRRDPDVQGTVYALSMAEGEELWSRRLGESSRFNPVDAPVAGDGLVYVPTGTGPLVALDADSGETVWTLDPSGGVQASPALADDALFVGDLDGTLHALDAATGEESWTADVAKFRGGPAVGANGVYAATFDGTLVCWSHGGRERWRVTLDPPVAGTPVPAGGRLFVGTSEGLLYGLTVPE